MTKTTRAVTLVVMLLLFAPIVLLQKQLDPERHQFEPKNAHLSSMEHLPFQFLFGATLGFREAVAGLLWVRTDKFFHEGNYDAIIPMIRIITWLDPHDIDVFQTGAWHMDYNFTDSEQRSDRRYMGYSLALMEEAIADNPEKSKLYADLAFTHYTRKLLNVKKAIYWFERGQEVFVPNPATNLAQPDKNYGKWGTAPDPAVNDPQIAAFKISANTLRDADPTIVGHGLAHAYEEAGMIPQAIAEWTYCIQEHKRMIVEHPDTAPSDRSSLSISIKNRYETIQRVLWRQTQTKPPVDIDLHGVQLIRKSSKQFELKGFAHFVGAASFNLKTGEHKFTDQDGARFSFRIEDAGLKLPDHVELGLEPNLPKGITILQDSCNVVNGAFDRRSIDMSKDGGTDGMYSFVAPKYRFVIWFNPSDQASDPPNIHDRIGWTGEGMTDRDPKLVDDTGNVPGSLGAHQPGLRMIKAEIDLTREDLTDPGYKVFQVVP